MEFHDVRNLKDLALVLGCKHSQISYYAFVKSDEEKYKEFEINKKGGGTRQIATPALHLKNILKDLAVVLESYYSPRQSVHGYVKDRSIISNANKHIRQKLVARVDIKDFFPSITTRRIIGVFLSPPFNLNIKLAVALAKLVTYKASLPQGAPTSPIISNLICRTLDSKVARLAREHRCYFTRYADDFYFSTNHSNFPESLVLRDKNGLCRLGDELLTVFDGEGFTVNEAKISIKDSSQRQIVTGIVVNEKLNVTRRFIREIRAMLYSWEKFGFADAEKNWLTNCDFRNRPEWQAPRFNWVLRGKVNHVGAVKGKSDATYLSLARRLAALDEGYTIDPKAITDSIVDEIVIYTEGKTDSVHIKKALEYFHSKGEFLGIKMRFDSSMYGEGDDALKKMCKALSTSLQRKLTVALFDSDVQRVVDEMKGSLKAYKDHGNNVYSMVLPNPPFRGKDPICIEHCYEDRDLTKCDSSGRRLYLIEEFDSKLGFHTSLPNVYKTNPHKKTLIVDCDVVDITTKKNIALPKAKFGELVEAAKPPFDTLNFEGFRNLFCEIEELRSEYLDSL